MTYAVIRRHRVSHADLDDLVRLGTIDPILREFLGACVRAEKNIMIAGKQKAGKTDAAAGDAQGDRPGVPVRDHSRPRTSCSPTPTATTGRSYSLVGRESNGERTSPDGAPARSRCWT